MISCTGDVRLVTLTGPGGVGKTRLALHVAQDLASAFADGIAFVALTPLTDPALVAPIVATALGVREAGDRSLTDSLADALRDRALLLVLDNFEQVLAAAPLLAELLGACPLLTFLVTSRAPLHVSGEHLFPVPPLALPDPAGPPEQVAEAEAVRLFVARARAADPAFALTAENAASAAGDLPPPRRFAAGHRAGGGPGPAAPAAQPCSVASSGGFRS